jgi:hypothetical protein
MKNKHVSEQELQQYAEDPALLRGEQIAHIDSCEHCRALVNSYKLVFSAIHETEAEAFQFDLAAAVLEQIGRPVQKTAPERVLLYSGVAAACILTGLGIYFFREYFQSIANGISIITWVLAVLSVLVMIAFIATDTYKRYQKKIRQLDLY